MDHVNVKRAFNLGSQSQFGSEWISDGWYAGFMPSSELLRHSIVQKLFARVIQHGLLRFRKQTRTCSQAAVDLCNLALDDAFKGSTFPLDN